MGAFSGSLDRYFRISERGSTVGAELRGGLATFLTQAYILFANPAVLSFAGIPTSDAVLATALSSATGCIVCGLFANLPLSLAPGLGLSAYLAYGVVQHDEDPDVRGRALACCFGAGVVLAVLAVTRMGNALMKFIPTHIKLATVVGMGMLLAFIGTQNIRLVVQDPDTLVTLGPLFSDWRILVSLGGFLLVSSLIFLGVPGAIIVGILAVTVTVWAAEGSWPHHVVDLPSLAEGRLPIVFRGLSAADAGPTLAFLGVLLFDVSGVLYGMARLAGVVGADDRVPGALGAFLASAAGTIVAALLGSTPVIIHVESAAGIKEGARTGLASLVAASFFLLSVFLAPLFAAVPAYATAPVLMLIGSMMMSEAANIDWRDMRVAVPSFLTAVMMPFTYDVAYGLAFGICAAVILFFTTGRFVRYLPAAWQCKRIVELHRDEDGSVGADADAVEDLESAVMLRDAAGSFREGASAASASPRARPRRGSHRSQRSFLDDVVASPTARLPPFMLRPSQVDKDGHFVSGPLPAGLAEPLAISTRRSRRSTSMPADPAGSAHS